MNWKDYMTQAEIARVAELDSERRARLAEYRRIYDRCRKRMKREQETALETKGANPQKS